MYIPPPPEEFTKDAIRTPEPVYTYPPTTPILPAQKRRFKWWKRRLTSKGQNRDKDGQKGSEKGGGNVDEKVIEGQDDREEVVLWEENWEQGEYPFVRLEGNRAACAICLMDFEEPKRVRSSTKVEGKDDESTPGEDRGIEQLVREVPVEEIDETTEEPERLKLSDAGEGPQPLRLLACGHVFHVSCQLTC
jgi:hypothetical protein